MGGAGFETNFFVRHDPCPSCGSRNNLGRYSDGHGHCYGCGYREAGNGRVLEKTSNGAPIRQAKLEMNGTYEAIPERRISVDTCRKFGVTVEKENGVIVKHHYPFKNKEGETKASKVRVVKNKEFYATGSTQGLALFGQDTCKGSGRFITITEGELDCLSVSEMFERKWDVVSLRNGASAAIKEIKEQFLISLSH